MKHYLNLNEAIKNGIIHKILHEEITRQYLGQQCVECSTPEEDVMNIYYGIKGNGCKPMKLNETSISRLIGKHSDNGMIIISANRYNKSKRENMARTKDLKSKIQNAGYSYLPVYGGYQEDGMPAPSYEPSFVVFNYGRDGQQRDFNVLADNAVKWCGDYEQDSVYVKAPNHAPVYVDCNGKIVNKRESNNVKIDDPKQIYFTSLKNKKHGFTADIEFPNDDEVVTDRMLNGGNFENINEWYFNPVPMTINEIQRRKALGEVMLWN